MSFKPVMRCMWIADNARKDVASGRIHVDGIFEHIFLSRSDIRYNTPCRLFFGVTGLHSDTDILLNLVDLRTNDILAATPLRVIGDDPVASHDFTLHVPTMPIPHEGVYGWMLLHEGEKLASVRFEAHYAQDQEGEEQ
jgi:hypothetical protein